MCMQQSPTAGELFSWTMPQEQPQAENALITGFRESYSSMSMSLDSWVKKTEEVKQLVDEFWHLPGSAEVL